MHFRIEKMFLQLFLSKYCYVVCNWQKMGVLERECFQQSTMTLWASYWNSWQRGSELAVHCFVHSTIAKKFHIIPKNRRKWSAQRTPRTHDQGRDKALDRVSVCDEGTCDGVCVCAYAKIMCTVQSDAHERVAEEPSSPKTQERPSLKNVKFLKDFARLPSTMYAAWSNIWPCCTVLPKTPPSPNQHRVIRSRVADNKLARAAASWATKYHLSAQGLINGFVSRYTWYDWAAGAERCSQNDRKGKQHTDTILPVPLTRPAEKSRYYLSDQFQKEVLCTVFRRK